VPECDVKDENSVCERKHTSHRFVSFSKRASDQAFRPKQSERKISDGGLVRRDGGFSGAALAGCCSLFGEELQRAVGGGDLTHGVAASLRETSGGGRLVVDVDAVVRPLDGRRAGRRAEETCKAGGWRKKKRGFYLMFHRFINSGHQ